MLIVIDCLFRQFVMVLRRGSDKDDIYFLTIDGFIIGAKGLFTVMLGYVFLCFFYLPAGKTKVDVFVSPSNGFDMGVDNISTTKEGKC